MRKSLSLFLFLGLGSTFLPGATIRLDVGYLERDSALNPTNPVVQTLSGLYATMVGQRVELTRGIDPVLGPLNAIDPNYFTEVVATASPTKLKIFNRGSLSNMPIGSFPKPTNLNSFNFNRTDFTGYAGASISDQLNISGGEGQGFLNVVYNLSGRGVAAGGANANINICPSVFPNPNSGCFPRGISVRTGTFSESWTYVFPFTYGLDFNLNSNLYSWIFIDEPTGSPNSRYLTGGTVDAMNSLAINEVFITNSAGGRVSNTLIRSSSGIDYFNIEASENAANNPVPEPSSFALLLGPVALYVWSRRVSK